MKALVVVAFCLVAAAIATDDAYPAGETFPEMKQGSTADRTRLLAKLFGPYNKLVNPDDILLKFGVNLIDFKVVAQRNILETYVWFKYTWQDDRLEWEPEEFGGVEVIRLDPNEIWKPDVTLYNSADPVNMINCWDSNVLIWSTGKVLWVPPCKMQSQCSFTLNKEPYGEQNCTLKFGSWTFDGNIMDVSFYNNKTSLDLSDMHNSSGFEIVGNVAEKNVRYYSCCKEPYQDLSYNITLKRVPGAELFSKY